MANDVEMKLNLF